MCFLPGVKRSRRKNQCNISSARLLLVLLPVITALSGCATYSTGFVQVESELVKQNPVKALDALEKMDHPDRDRVLYLMNKAMLLRMAGNYSESNLQFEEAKRLIQERDAISISEQTTSFIINDATRAFIGEPFEQTMVHIFSALNYLDLSQLDEARVEALQADVRLNLLNKRGGASPYKEDAFARYLSGIIFEMLGEWSNAMIAYRKAYQAYSRQNASLAVPVPVSLKHALLRLSSYLEITNEFEKFKTEFAVADWDTVAKLNENGEFILLSLNGLTPVKRESSHLLPNPGTGRLLRVSLPYYESRPLQVDSVRVIADKQEQRTETVENIDAIARVTLEARMPEITARAIARMVVKDQAARAAGEQNDWAGILTNVFNVMTERADTRSWLTLPAEIQLTRFSMPPGTYQLTLEWLDGSGNTVTTKTIDAVALKAGEKKLLSFHWLPNHLPHTRH